MTALLDLALLRYDRTSGGRGGYGEESESPLSFHAQV